ncbi:MAG: S8 family peptidase [Winogradskyella sp.]
MKKSLLIIGLVGLVGFSQTAEQREVIKKSTNQTELLRLKNKFEKDYQAQTKKVDAYLAANPSVKRNFTKNGSFYALQRIADDGTPIYINTKSNIGSGQLIKANELYSGGSIGANITGTNMVAGVWDGGQVRATHELLSGEVTMQAGQTVNSAGGNDHMTHVSGTMVGKDLGSSHPEYSARGIAYDATSHNYDWDNDIAELTAFASNGYLISNHSYGPANDTSLPTWYFGAYDSSAQSWDAFLKNAPNYLPFIAAGNEQSSNGSGKTGPDQGYDVMTSATAAKNVMVVGAVNADRSMSDYSNFGPTDDGRIKPDICTRGTGINSSQASSDTAYSGDGPGSSGTSYASPAAAAAGLLLQQYYYSLNNSYMSASMLKALMLHTADDEGAAGPDLKFGWGILNIERAAQVIKDAKTTGKARFHTFTTNPANDSNSELNISGNGVSTAYTGLGTGEIKVSMCWTDDEGTQQTGADGVDPTDSRLVYNFDFLFRRTNNFTQVYPYKQFTMATRTSVASLGTGWFQNNADVYRQTYLPAGSTLGDTYILYLRKSASSPAAARNISVIITGLAESSLLSTNDVEVNNSRVFYSATDQKIKLINNTNTGFGTYRIFDIAGKQIANGKTNANEIAFSTTSTGVYIINFENNGVTSKLKFIKK